MTVSYLVNWLSSSKGVSHRRWIWELPAPTDAGDDKAHLRGENCQRYSLEVGVGKGVALLFKGSDFPVCLCVVPEAEKWNLTDQDLKRNNSALWSEPYSRNPKS